MEGDTIVIHQVTDKIVLRKGVYATCVFNRNPFGTRIGAESQTQSPFVKRKTLGGEGDE